MTKNITIKKLFYLVMAGVVAISIAYVLTSNYYTKKYMLESLEQQSVVRAYRVAKKLSQIHDRIAIKYESHEDKLRASLDIAKEYIKIHGPQSNLGELKKNLEQKYHDLKFNVYIINSQYIINNTTYTPDIGLDFHNIPLALINVDKAYKNPQSIDVSHVTNDTVANDYKMYILQRVIGKDYMIQLSMVSNDDDEIEKEFIQNMSNTVPSLLKSAIYLYLPFQKIPTSIVDKLWVLDHKLKTKQKRIKSEDSYKEFTSLFNPKNTSNVNAINDEIHDFVQNDKLKIINDYTQEPYTQKVILPFQSYLNMNENSGYILYLEFDQSEASQIINNMNNIQYTIWFLLFLVIVIFISTLNRYIIDPITLVKSKMQKKEPINELNLSNTNNEINSMVIIYNQLFHDLQREIISNEELLEKFKIFTANTIHQVRTPISVIKIALEMVETDNKEALLQIQSSLLSMEHIYDSLSYMINQGNIIFKKEKINLSELLKQRVGLFNTIAMAHDITMEDEIQTNIIISLNTTEAEFLIDNNISNAIKYSLPKKPIRIRLLQADQNILLLFESPGNQIKDISTMFERYKRGDKTKQGSGIGLNIVDSICKSNNILINVDYIDGYNRFTYIFEKNTT